MGPVNFDRTHLLNRVTFLIWNHLDINQNTEEALRHGSLYLQDVFMLFLPQEKGQGLVEYAIILALIAIVVIAIVRLMGAELGNTYSTINSSLPN